MNLENDLVKVSIKWSIKPHSIVGLKFCQEKFTMWDMGKKLYLLILELVYLPYAWAFNTSNCIPSDYYSFLLCKTAVFRCTLIHQSWRKACLTWASLNNPLSECWAEFTTIRTILTLVSYLVVIWKFLLDSRKVLRKEKKTY